MEGRFLTGFRWAALHWACMKTDFIALRVSAVCQGLLTQCLARLSHSTVAGVLALRCADMEHSNALSEHCEQGATSCHAVQVKWGEHSMVEALRALLREALKDPLNQRFQLLCEYSLPLQSPLLVYQQFIKQSKSRLNACNTFDWQEHVSLSPSALVYASLC